MLWLLAASNRGTGLVSAAGSLELGVDVAGDVGVDGEGQCGVGEVRRVQDGLAQQHAVLLAVHPAGGGHQHEVLHGCRCCIPYRNRGGLIAPSLSHGLLSDFLLAFKILAHPDVAELR